LAGDELALQKPVRLGSCTIDLKQVPLKERGWTGTKATRKGEAEAGGWDRKWLVMTPDPRTFPQGLQQGAGMEICLSVGKTVAVPDEERPTASLNLKLPKIGLSVVNEHVEEILYVLFAVCAVSVSALHYLVHILLRIVHSSHFRFVFHASHVFACRVQGTCLSTSWT